MDIVELLERVRQLRPSGAIAREAVRLRRDELAGSLAISGSPLTRDQLDVLCDRGLATGDHPLAAYLAARDLATAAAWVSDQRAIQPGDPRPLMTIEDLRRLHVIASGSQPEMRPGVWRLTVEPPAASGIVYPAPWAVASAMEALVDRYRRRPALDDVPVWLAAFLGRYARIRPFGAGNGRASRLAASLLLRRLDIVPLAIGRERAAAYRAAIAASAAGNPHPLEGIIGEALRHGCRRLVACGHDEPLQPLRRLAGDDYAALIKAAKRGRLDVVVRDGRVLSTASWVEDYRRGRWLTSALG